MLRQEKQELIDSMKASVESAQAVLFLDFTGLTVAEETALRNKYRQSGVGYQVVKNTLMKRAVAGTSYEGAAKFLKGTPTGVVIGSKDPVTPAKITFEFLKECEHIKVKGGIFDKKAIGAKEAEALSKMPSREEMLAQVLAIIMSPATKLIRQIKGPGGRVAGAIKAKADKGE